MFDCLPEYSMHELSTNILKIFEDYDMQTSYMYQRTKKGLYIQRMNRITCLSRTSINMSINLIDNTIVLYKYDIVTQHKHKYPRKLQLKNLTLLEYEFEKLVRTVL